MDFESLPIVFFLYQYKGVLTGLKEKLTLYAPENHQLNVSARLYRTDKAVGSLLVSYRAASATLFQLQTNAYLKSVIRRCQASEPDREQSGWSAKGVKASEMELGACRAQRLWLL